METIKDYNRMKNIASILRTIIRVLFWIFVGLVGLLVIAEIVFMMIPKDVLVLKDVFRGNMVIAIDGLFEYDFTSQTNGDLMLKQFILFLIPTVILNLVFYLVNFNQVQKILGSLIKDQPFEASNSKRLFIMSMTFFTGAVVFKIAEELVMRSAVMMFGAQSYSVSITPNFTLLFTGMLLLILSSVFKYGDYLQYEYDETV